MNINVPRLTVDKEKSDLSPLHIYGLKNLTITFTQSEGDTVIVTAKESL